MSTCWFCEIRPADASASIEVEMSTNVKKIAIPGTKYYKKTYQSDKVLVPRCTKCKMIFKKKDIIAWTGALISLLFGAGVAMAIAFLRKGSIGRIGWLDVIIGIIFFIIGSSIAIYRGIKVPGSNEIKNTITDDFPKVKKMKEQGWKIGIPT